MVSGDVASPLGIVAREGSPSHAHGPRETEGVTDEDGDLLILAGGRVVCWQ